MQGGPYLTGRRGHCRLESAGNARPTRRFCNMAVPAMLDVPCFERSERMRSTAINISILLSACCIAASTPSLHAGDWADRAGQLNRKEITAGEAAQQNKGSEQDRRNKLCVRRIRPAEVDVDWNADPTALPYMMYQINKRTNLPVFINNEGLDLSKDEIFEHTVLYLTSHRRWTFNEKETSHMQLFLKRGGTLWLDDCYPRGSPFSDSVRPEVAKMAPGCEPVMLNKTDPKVNDTFRMVYAALPWPGEAEFENRPWQYFVLDGRAAIFFTPNDDGCSWEVSTPPSASNPIGEGIGHGGDNREPRNDVSMGDEFPDVRLHALGRRDWIPMHTLHACSSSIAGREVDDRIPSLSAAIRIGAKSAKTPRAPRRKKRTALDSLAALGVLADLGAHLQHTWASDREWIGRNPCEEGTCAQSWALDFYPYSICFSQPACSFLPQLPRPCATVVVLHLVPYDRPEIDVDKLEKSRPLTNPVSTPQGMVMKQVGVEVVAWARNVLLDEKPIFESYLDGKYVGRAPVADADLKPGEHVIWPGNHKFTVGHRRARSRRLRRT